MLQQLRSLFSFFIPSSPTVKQIRDNYSPTLGRDVAIDIYLPPGYKGKNGSKYPFLVVNDGQDLTVMNFERILSRLYSANRIPHIIVIAVHAGTERIREYGTARQADYKGRGDKARVYKQFILSELIPFVFDQYAVTNDPNRVAFTGFSLGGLSALDIGWDTPELFGTVGVFSGALWWRWSPVTDQNPDGDRIMHDIIRTTVDELPDHQRFWFQIGTLDENEDRNHNNVIDAIDDTIDLIRELKRHGYPNEQIRYLEIEDGTHDPMTWARAMPDFLAWTFGR